ncbi:protease modulator HflC [Methylobrevis albus]|uniref:Protein HflC n=1 Tax=Methylobrevis albus TaxID=2793297 RepID=A0A931HZV1_9HYPH|nr:protease modulator HflC [Methylobrevis albus]MBH0236718.1 protease modulator HflC [Methylobrevis albus]
MRALALPVVLIVTVVAALLVYSATFVVSERDTAIQLRFGEIQRVVTDPGLYFKYPTNIVDQVQYVDKRLLSLEITNTVVQVNDSRQYVVDAFATFRITDPRAFRESVSANPVLAAERLRTRFDASLRQVYGSRSFDAALSEARGEMMREVRDRVRPEAAQLGVSVVELRIRRTELPNDVRQQTYERMRSERLAQAAELRAQGTQESLRIRAEADRQATVLVAEAQRDSEILRGEGDAEKNRIFGEAFTVDADFFEFYRSMQAYETALESAGTTMVISPTSDFFRFFNSANGTEAYTPAPAPAQPPAPGQPVTPGAPAASAAPFAATP